MRDPHENGEQFSANTNHYGFQFLAKPSKHWWYSSKDDGSFPYTL